MGVNERMCTWNTTPDDSILYWMVPPTYRLLKNAFQKRLSKIYPPHFLILGDYPLSTSFLATVLKIFLGLTTDSMDKSTWGISKMTRVWAPKSTTEAENWLAKVGLWTPQHAIAYACPSAHNNPKQTYKILKIKLALCVIFDEWKGVGIRTWLNDQQR